MRPPASRMTFCALTSRCRRPAACTARSAPQRSMPIAVASAAENTPSAFTRCASVWPVMNSVQIPIRPSISSAPNTVTTFGCLTRASSRPSSITPRASMAPATAEIFQRNVARQTRVLRTVDLSECTAADLFDDRQRPPARSTLQWCRTAMHAGERGEDAELCDLGSIRTGHGLDRPPIDRHAVQNRLASCASAGWISLPPSSSPTCHDPGEADDCPTCGLRAALHSACSKPPTLAHRTFPSRAGG